ncbi:MAG: ABC-F family ATP-binding cassette domain-containing protein [Bacillota bacterium]
MVLQVQEITKSFGEHVVLNNVSFLINEKERIGLVGPNGAGKTTLLRCLTGELLPDKGQVILASGARIGYLAQGADLPEDQAVWEAMLNEFRDLTDLRHRISLLEQEMSNPQVYGNPQVLQQVLAAYSSLTTNYEYAGGYSFEARIKAVLGGLGFGETDWKRTIKEFSGGQKTRLALGKMLLREPELVILDEPTNYLDMAAVEWLESFLIQYPGAVLVVSHDRYFLDQVVERILDLENGQICAYPGNYTRFAEQKAQKIAAQEKESAKQQATIEKTEEFIRRNHAGQNSRQAKSRENRLERMARLEKPHQSRWFSFRLTPLTASADKVLSVKGLTAGYDREPVISSLNMEILRGERVALLGENGSGKTTLLKCILGILNPRAGEVVLGPRVRTGYFAQEHETLTREATLLEEVLKDNLITLDRARNLLGQFMFSGDEVYKKTSQLSGGERTRLMLAKLCLTGANFLVLDEPTNHLDIKAREVLEEVLSEYPGTILMVSHDRYFLNRLADRILELEKGTLKEYLGNYDYYRWKRNQSQPPVQKEASSSTAGKKSSAITPEQNQRLRLEQIEKQIEELEANLSQLTALMSDQAATGELESLCGQYALTKMELTRLYEEWSQLIERET